MRAEMNKTFLAILIVAAVMVLVVTTPGWNQILGISGNEGVVAGAIIFALVLYALFAVLGEK